MSIYDVSDLTERYIVSTKSFTEPCDLLIMWNKEKNVAPELYFYPSQPVYAQLLMTVNETQNDEQNCCKLNVVIVETQRLINSFYYHNVWKNLTHSSWTMTRRSKGWTAKIWQASSVDKCMPCSVIITFRLLNEDRNSHKLHTEGTFYRR